MFQNNITKLILVVSLFLIMTNAWSAQITVEGAYVRHLPPTQKITGAFMVLNNLGDKDISVISAQSEVAEKLELHTHIHDGGVMRMRQVEKIDLPAHGQVELKPGGFHIMLIGLKKPLALDQVVAIKLHLDDGSTELVEAKVKSVMAGMKMQGMKKEKMEHN